MRSADRGGAPVMITQRPIVRPTRWVPMLGGHSNSWVLLPLTVGMTAAIRAAVVWDSWLWLISYAVTVGFVFTGLYVYFTIDTRRRDRDRLPGVLLSTLGQFKLSDAQRLPRLKLVVGKADESVAYGWGFGWIWGSASIYRDRVEFRSGRAGADTEPTFSVAWSEVIEIQPVCSIILPMVAVGLVFGAGDRLTVEMRARRRVISALRQIASSPR